MAQRLVVPQLQSSDGFHIWMAFIVNLNIFSGLLVLDHEDIFVDCNSTVEDGQNVCALLQGDLGYISVVFPSAIKLEDF